MFIIPYLVLAAVALLFSFICYMMFFGVPGRKKTADHREIEKKASEVPSREDIVNKVPLPKSEPHKEKKLYTDEKTQILPPRLGKTKKAEADEEKTKIFSKEELEKRQKGILCRMPRDRSRQNPILSSSMRNRMWISLKNTLSNIS